MCAILLSSKKAFADICSNICTDCGLAMAAANNASVSARGVPRLPRAYSVDGYIQKYSRRLDARQLAILPVQLTLTVSFLGLIVRRRKRAGCVVGKTGMGGVLKMTTLMKSLWISPSSASWGRFLTRNDWFV